MSRNSRPWRLAIRPSVVKSSGWRAARASATARLNTLTVSVSATGTSGTTTCRPRDPLDLRTAGRPSSPSRSCREAAAARRTPRSVGAGDPVDPVGEALADLLLEEAALADPVGEPLHGDRAPVHQGQHPRRDRLVVADQVGLGDGVVGEQHLVRVADPHPAVHGATSTASGTHCHSRFTLRGRYLLPPTPATTDRRVSGRGGRSGPAPAGPGWRRPPAGCSRAAGTG